MAKDLSNSTSKTDTRDIGQAVDEMKLVAESRRRIFERRWYDNNFFDDGYHFRYLSRTTNKIVDLSERSTIYTPQRAIPKASRQIRGVTNLLMSQDPTPTVYPEPIDFTQFPDEETLAKEKERQKTIAKKRGMWLLNEWKKDDGSGETILEKVALMVLLALKHGIAYMQVWPDAVDEVIQTQVYDAFDIYTLGNYTSIYHVPFIIKSVPMLISQIKANEIYDKDQLNQISPDNRKANSQIKEAYMLARFGQTTTSDQSATLILNEAFIKEYLNDDNMARIRGQEGGDKILKGKKTGDPIIRHVFTAGGVWLYDQYTSLSEYPFVDYRMEPGPLYQVPLLERFMAANKSLDSIVSRVERYTHTMVTGSWLKRRGENFRVNNIAGGQIIEYDGTPPTQNQIASIPPFVFEFISLLTNFIEEQGVSTTTLGKLPSGVKANAAIESLKESEYANLVIATRRLTGCMKRLARKCLEIADEYYVSPKKISMRDGADVVNFAVIGQSAYNERKRLKVDTPYQVITLSKDTPVEIEIEQGMAYTKEGQKKTMQELMNTMIQGVQVQAVPPQALQSVFKKYLETYQFGSTEEFMDDFDKALQGANMNDQQIMQMKTALLEALQEAGEVGPQASQKRVMENKVGVLEALQQSGMAKQVMGAQPVKESVAINYKDAPEDVKRQMEQKAGFQPSRMVSPAVSDQVLAHAKAMTELQKPEMQQQQLLHQAGMQSQQLQASHEQAKLQVQSKQHGQTNGSTKKSKRKA